jgi:hypothetical protein
MPLLAICIEKERVWPSPDQMIPVVLVGDGWSQRFVFLDVDDKLPVVGTLQVCTKDGQQLHREAPSQTRWNLDPRTERACL